LGSSNIWGSLYSKMRDLFVTKCFKRECSIVNKFFRCFLANYDTIDLSNREACDRDCLVYQTFLNYWKKNDWILVLLILFGNLNQRQFF
jgi:hypothetical protein